MVLTKQSPQHREGKTQRHTTNPTGLCHGHNKLHCTLGGVGCLRSQAEVGHGEGRISLPFLCQEEGKVKGVSGIISVIPLLLP